MSKLFVDTAKNLILWDKFYFIDENFFSYYKDSESYDSYTLYLLGAEKDKNTDNHMLLVVLAVPPGWDEDSEEFPEPLVLSVPYGETVSLEIHKDFAGWRSDIESVQRNLVEHYLKTESPLLPDKYTKGLSEEMKKEVLKEMGMKDIQNELIFMAASLLEEAQKGGQQQFIELQEMTEQPDWDSLDKKLYNEINKLLLYLEETEDDYLQNYEEPEDMDEDTDV